MICSTCENQSAGLVFKRSEYPKWLLIFKSGPTSGTISGLLSAADTTTATSSLAVASRNGTVFYSPCPTAITSPVISGPPPQTIHNSFAFANSTPSLHNLFPNIQSGKAAAVPTTTTHPCPNSGYSCSTCPGGWFCPPVQTPAASCPCGYGWACADCVGGFYCIPGPTVTIGSTSHLNTVTSVAVPIVSNIPVVVEQNSPETSASKLPLTIITSDAPISIITTAVPIVPMIVPREPDSNKGIKRKGHVQKRGR